MGQGSNKRWRAATGMTATERSRNNRAPRIPDGDGKEHFFDGSPEDATSVAKGRFFIENAPGINRHTLFEKSADVFSSMGFKYDKVCVADAIPEFNNNNNNNKESHVTVVCTKEQVKTFDVTRSDVEKPVLVGWTFAVFEEIYFHEVNKTIWHFNRSLWKAYNERRGVSVSYRPIPNNFKKMLCKNFQPGNPDACQNQDNCTFAHGQEELDKYKRDCQYGSGCLNKSHNCPYAHPLEGEAREELIEAAGPLYKTKMCERHRKGSCSYGDRCWFAHGEEELRSGGNMNNNNGVIQQMVELRFKTRKKSVGGDTDDNEDEEENMHDSTDSDSETATTISDTASEYDSNDSKFYKTKLCAKFESGRCPYEDDCQFAHGKDDLRKMMCKFGNRCRNRSKCLFAHPDDEEEDAEENTSASPPAASPVPPQATSSPAETSSPNSRRPPFYKMALCRNWLNNVAGCPFGDRCNFAHGRDQLRAQVLPCERGAQCPDKQLCQYSHPEQKVSLDKLIEMGKNKQGNRNRSPKTKTSNRGF